MLGLKLLFSMSGRMNRTTYILISFVAGTLTSALAFGIDLAAYSDPEHTTSNASWAIMLLGIYSQAAMLTKRIRDTGKSTALVGVYFVSLALGLIAFVFGLVSPIALIIGVLLLGVSGIITLIAIFAQSAPGGNSKSSTLDGLAMNDPMTNPQADDDFNADADAIIARALEMRKNEQESAGEDVLRPVTRAATPVQKGQSGGFGRRNAPAFGNR